MHISGKDLAAREMRWEREEKNVGAKPLRRLAWRSSREVSNKKRA